METLLIFTNYPNYQGAKDLAHMLVESKLAACVNILTECTSVYRWDDKIEHAQEVPMIIKTSADMYPQVESAIKHAHPYELPEIIAVPIVKGLPGYVNWILEQTKEPNA
jgi:periplasmic divalent cation tolerance protein